MTPLLIHDSEDWLLQLIDDYFPKDKRHARGQALLMKDAILAHYAHYLKPEEVERERLGLMIWGYEKSLEIVEECWNNGEGLTKIENDINDQIEFLKKSKAQLSKLKRSEGE